MTWFHYDNYGTVLQAAALSRVLKSYGHEVDVIDYFPGEHVLILPGGSERKTGISQLMRSRRERLNPVITTQISGEAFDRFRETDLTRTPCCETLTDLEHLNELYDAFVCGSDMIWLPMRFDPRFYLDFVKDPERMIAYAPSILDTGTADPLVLEQMRTLIGRFSHLSVREENGRHFMDETFVTKTLELADPTLLIEPDDWAGSIQLAESAGDQAGAGGGRYMLVMFKNPSRGYQDAAAKLAARLLLPQMVIPVHESDLRCEGVIRDGVGPNQFVSLIRNADYICTDSYHGIALSISFQKEFCCFEQFTDRSMLALNDRVHHILDAVGLRERLYSPDTSIEQYIRPIDYIPVNYKLDALKLKSREFLKTSLEQVAQKVAMDIPVSHHILQSYSLCSGCGVCEAVCEKEALRIEPDGNGFFKAVVNEDRCIRCEACRKVCPFDGADASAPLAGGRLLSYRDEDPALLEGSQAGGAAGRFARLLKEKGATVVGCALDEAGKAVLQAVRPEDEDALLDALKGVKLMACEPGNIWKDLAAQERDEDEEAEGDEDKEASPAEHAPFHFEGATAVFGVPCQIAGARKLLAGRDDILYIELTCSGVPTTLLRQKRFHSTLTSRNAAQALDQALESGLFCERACYDCRWRKTTLADIRIGDFVESEFEGQYEPKRSGLTVMTDKGTALINELMISGYWEGLHKADMGEYMAEHIDENPPMPVFYEQAFEKLRDEKVSLNRLLKDYVKHLSE